MTTILPTDPSLHAITRARVRVLNLPFRGERGGFDDSELVHLLAEKDGAQVSEHFFTHAGRPFLACFVRWNEPCGQPGTGPREESPPEPRPARRRARSTGAAKPVAEASELELDPAARRVHDSLRSWRAGRARELGVPAYRVLTNRLLEALARARPTEAAALHGISGLGPATARVHGEAIVARIREALASAPASGAA